MDNRRIVICDRDRASKRAVAPLAVMRHVAKERIVSEDVALQRALKYGTKPLDRK